jgi:hypothetical protein
MLAKRLLIRHDRNLKNKILRVSTRNEPIEMDLNYNCF